MYPSALTASEITNGNSRPVSTASPMISIVGKAEDAAKRSWKKNVYEN